MSQTELRYEEFAPPPPLDAWVRCIWRLEAPAGMAGAPEPIVPDGCAELVINLADPFVRHAAAGVSHVQPVRLVAGQITRALTIAASGRVDLWGVRFHPWSAARFFGVSGAELRDVVVPLDAVSLAAERALGAMAEARTEVQQREALLRVVSEHLAQLPAADASLPRIVSFVTRASGDRTVRDLACDSGLSVRRLQSVFRDAVGLSPRHLRRIVRLQRALALKRSNQAMTWGAVAARAGYHDQAHLNRDARDIAGCAPGALLGPHSALTEAFLEG